MPIAARRVFRLSLTTALALAVAYASATALPFIAPILALLLASAPKPPLGPKAMIGALVFIAICTGFGLLLVPMLLNYPFSAVLIVMIALFLSNYLSINLGKAAVGTFLTMGVAMISAAGLASFVLAQTVIDSLLLGIVIAVACHWVAYALFPEDEVAAPETPPTAETSKWVALRATLIVMPAYLVTLSNPAMYMPLIMKTVALGQQSSAMNTRDAGRELLGSTFLGGCFAALLWVALKMEVNLWMYFLWVLLFVVYVASKIYGVMQSRYPASFWMNTAITAFILLGSAVIDSKNGNDVYAAFAVRLSLFVVVTLYAWSAVVLLERLRNRRRERNPPVAESS